MFSAIAKTFRGERPLWETYWLWGALPSAVLGVSMKVSMPLLIEHALDHPNLPTIAYYGFTCIWGAFVVFFAGAVWRSSASYKGYRVWAVLARVVVVLGALNFLGSLIPGAHESSLTDNSIEGQLADTAASLNKGLPKQMNDYTQLVRVTADHKTLTYHHAMVNMKEEELPANPAESMHASSVKTACASGEFVSALRSGVTFVYEYSLDGRSLFSYEITARDCQQ